MIKTKPMLALILCALLLLLTACQSGETPSAASSAPTAASSAPTAAASAGADSSAAPEPPTGGKLLEEPITVDMWIVENPTYVYQKDLLLERELGERLNIFFNVTAFQTGVEERINLGLASGDLPDIYSGVNLSRASDWGARQGALVNLAEHAADMPNYTAWAGTVGDYTSYFTTANGGLYFAPNYGYGMASNSTFWMYREDLFEKHGLAVPTNEAELYEVCKALKAEYPDSYPFACRSWTPGLGILGRIAYQWGSAHNMYYSNAQQAWTYAQLEPGFRECIEWLSKMYTEELMPPNSLSLDTAGWQEVISTNKGFIFNDYQARIDFFAIEMNKTDPTVKFSYMTPFQGGANGTAKFDPQTQLIIDGMGIFVTSDYVPELVKYFDWFYTDEAEELMSWGVEGESFAVNPDGTKYHLGMEPGKSVFFDLVNTYGLFQRGFYCLVDPPSHTASIASEAQINAVEHVLTDAGEYRIPSISFSEANQEAVTALGTAITTASDEALGMFITGQRPMSEYDAFLAELNALGLQDLIKLYNDQQAEINANRGG